MNDKYTVPTSDLKQRLERKEIIKKLADLESGFFKNLLKSLIKQSSIWIVSFLIAFVSIFSDSITQRIKTNFNRANIQTEGYEKIANNISQYIFAAELIKDFYKDHHKDPAYAKMIAKEYNNYITEIRKTEYSHLALIKKHSGESISNEYKNLISNVKKLDKSIHGLNTVGIIIARIPDDSLIQYTPQMLSTIGLNIPKIKSNIQSVVHKTEELLDKL